MHTKEKFTQLKYRNGDFPWMMFFNEAFPEGIFLGGISQGYFAYWIFLGEIFSRDIV